MTVPPADRLSAHRAILTQRFPDVLARLDRDCGTAGVEVLSASSGHPTLSVVGRDGISRLLHSRRDPVSEARTLVEGIDPPDGGTVVCIGAALWYHIEQLVRSYPDVARILVIEPDPRILRRALEVRDLYALLASPRLMLSCVDDENGVTAFLASLGNTILHNGMRLFVLPSAERTDPETYRRIRTAVLAAVRVMEICARTNMAHARHFHANVLANVPAIAASPSIATLREVFAEKPAICVNAGPSLDKNIDVLREAVGRTVIIAVDVVLQRLLAKGIIPDMVVSIDFQACHYQDTFAGEEEKTRETYLVFDPELCPDIVRTWQGGKFFFSIDKPMGRWLASALGDCAVLPKGGCVGHAAFFLAEYLRCNPIILIGQDLSYPGITHADGVRVRQEIAIGDGSDGRKYLLKRGADGTWQASELFMVPDIDGKEVPTDHQMFAYLRQLEYAIARTDRTVIDATEGGARIAGTRIMTLREAIDRWCTASFAVKPLLAERVAAYRQEPSSRVLRGALEELRAQLIRARTVAGEGNDLLRRIRERMAGVSVPDRATERLLQTVEDTKNRLMEMPLWFREIAEYQMNANVWLLNAAAVRKLSTLNVRQRIAELMARFELYFAGYGAVVDDLLPRCETALCSLP